MSEQVYTLSAMIGTGSNAPWEIRINGNVEMSSSMSGSADLGTKNNGSIKLGGNAAYTTTYYYDDVAINSLGYPGGGAAAAPRGPSLPVHLFGPGQSINAVVASVGTLFSSANVSTLPQAVPVVLPSHLRPLQSAADSASTRRPSGNHAQSARQLVQSL